MAYRSHGKIKIVQNFVLERHLRHFSVTLHQSVPNIPKTSHPRPVVDLIRIEYIFLQKHYFLFRLRLRIDRRGRNGKPCYVCDAQACLAGFEARIRP